MEGPAENQNVTEGIGRKEGQVKNLKVTEDKGGEDLKVIEGWSK